MMKVGYVYKRENISRLFTVFDATDYDKFDISSNFIFLNFYDSVR